MCVCICVYVLCAVKGICKLGESCPYYHSPDRIEVSSDATMMPMAGPAGMCSVFFFIALCVYCVVLNYRFIFFVL